MALVVVVFGNIDKRISRAFQTMKSIVYSRIFAHVCVCVCGAVERCAEDDRNYALCGWNLFDYNKLNAVNADKGIQLYFNAN